jgi:hypothetical protein
MYPESQSRRTYPKQDVPERIGTLLRIAFHWVQVLLDELEHDVLWSQPRQLVCHVQTVSDGFAHLEFPELARLKTRRALEVVPASSGPPSFTHRFRDHGPRRDIFVLVLRRPRGIIEHIHVLAATITDPRATSTPIVTVGKRRNVVLVFAIWDMHTRDTLDRAVAMLKIFVSSSRLNCGMVGCARSAHRRECRRHEEDMGRSIKWGIWDASTMVFGEGEEEEMHERVWLGGAAWHGSGVANWPVWGELFIRIEIDEWSDGWDVSSSPKELM